MTHRIYYGKDYHPFFMPPRDKSDKSNIYKINEKFLKDWKEIIMKNAELTDNFVKQANSLNNSVVKKINIYRARFKK